jgi:anti-sigma factor RsiW
MTEAPLNHPGDATPRALSLGQLTEAELAQVSAHLADWPACCCHIDELATDDPLLARLQQGAASREQELVSPAQRRPAVFGLARAPADPAHLTQSGTIVGNVSLPDSLLVVAALQCIACTALQ